MSDRQVSLNGVLAVLGWTVGLAVIGLGFWLDTAWGFVGLAVVAMGSLFIVRGFLAGQEGRERDAFELGRASKDDAVRKLH